MPTTDEHAVSETTLPAGKYWVGDPCYAFDDHGVWMELLESADYTGPHRILEADAAGCSFVASGTAFGDGTYLDQQGNQYPVDAGLIGATPVVRGREIPFGMREVEFAEPFSVEYEDGKITLGDITIDTDPSGDNECLRCGDEAQEGESYCESCESYLEGWNE